MTVKPLGKSTVIWQFGKMKILTWFYKMQFGVNGEENSFKWPLLDHKNNMSSSEPEWYGK